MRVIDAPDGALLVDTATPVTAAWCREVKALGYCGIGRYTGHLSLTERDAILGAELTLLPIQYGGQARDDARRILGWHPTAALGEQRGRKMVADLRFRQIPGGIGAPGVPDVESPAASATAEECAAYVNAWDHVLREEGYHSVLYHGGGCPWSAEELFRLLTVDRYWDGAATWRDPSPAHRGDCLRQLLQEASGNCPGIEIRHTHNGALAYLLGVNVDINVAQADRLGGRLPLLAA